MADKMEYQGSDVDDAIQKACLQLNVPREKLEIEVLATGSAGIFGLGKKMAKILVSEKGIGGAVIHQQAGEENVSVFGLAEPEKKDRPEKRERKAAPVSQETMEAIRLDLVQILRLMGFANDVQVTKQNEKVVTTIVGEQMEELIGQDGKTLDSLQYILRKIISKKFSDKILFALDAGDFRAERAKELEELALKMAQEVKESGKTRSIQALNPAERRIVHLALQDDTTIRSRSVGDSLFKRILIYVPGKTRKKTPSRRRGPRRKP